MDGLREFRRRREEEIARIENFRDGDCFHNGTIALDTVYEILDNLADECGRCDFITGPTVDTVIKKMIQKAADRPSARQLYQDSMQILVEAKQKRTGRSFSGAMHAAGSFGTGGAHESRSHIYGPDPYMRRTSPEDLSIAQPDPQLVRHRPPPRTHIRDKRRGTTNSRQTSFQLDSDDEEQDFSQPSRRSKQTIKHRSSDSTYSRTHERIDTSPHLSHERSSAAIEVDVAPNGGARRVVTGAQSSARVPTANAEAIVRNRPGSFGRSERFESDTVETHRAHPLSSGASVKLVGRPFPTFRPSLPSLPVDEAHRWKRDKKNCKGMFGWKKRAHVLLPNNYLIETLRQRDHVSTYHQS